MIPDRPNQDDLEFSYENAVRPFGKDVSNWHEASAVIFFSPTCVWGMNDNNALAASSISLSLHESFRETVSGDTRGLP